MIFPCWWVYLRNLNSLKKLKQKLSGPELFLCKMGDEDDDSALVYMHWNLIRKICMWRILQLSLICLLRHILSTVLYLITQKFFLRLIQRLWVYDSVSQVLPWEEALLPCWRHHMESHWESMQKQRSPEACLSAILLKGPSLQMKPW